MGDAPEHEPWASAPWLGSGRAGSNLAVGAALS